MIRSTAFVLVALLAFALPADALFESHLDAFGTLVDQRLAVLPSTGGTKDEAKRRKALLKAAAALDLPSADRAGDLAIAKKAATAVQRQLAADAALMAALDQALDSYRAEADADGEACYDLLVAFPAGPLATRIGKKLLGVANLIEKEGSAGTFSARAAILASAFKKLVPLQEALGDGPPGGPCDPPGTGGVNLGTVTALVDGAAWSSTDIEVTLIVDSGTQEVIQIVVSARRPDGSGGTLDRIEVIFATGGFTGTGDYSFNTATVGPVGMRYWGPVHNYESLTGSAGVSEFSFTPTQADPDVAAGHIVGTFSFNGCTVWAGSDTCGALPVAVTAGTFDICNFNVTYY